jgi:uncharacterized protein YbaP (TraB family)
MEGITMKFLIVTAFFALFTFTHIQASAEPVWSNKSNGGDDYLLGTIHLGDERLAGLPDSIQKLVDAVDVIVVEVDLTALNPMDMQRSVMKYAMLPSEQSLRGLLSEDTFVKLQAYGKKVGIAVEQLDRFQPWFVALNLVQAAYIKQGFSTEFGVDVQLIQYAKSQNKSIVSLETFEQQLHVLHSLLSGNNKISANDMIEDTLIELTTYDHIPKKMLDAWLQGNMSQFEEIYQTTLSQSDYDKVYEKELVIDRNEAWLKVLPDMMAKQKVLVAVGTLHFAGPSAIQKKLPTEFIQQ